MAGLRRNEKPASPAGLSRRIALPTGIDPRGTKRAGNPRRLATGTGRARIDAMSQPAADLPAATERTIYFIGVTTGRSSIMKVFPAWSDHLGLGAVMRGIDLPLNADRARYRRVVDFIKADPLSLGGLVTTHKVSLLQAARDLFDDLDPLARALHEVSSISKPEGRLIGHAKDPISAGAAYEAIVPPRHWSRSGGHLCVLGAGGSSLALTLYLHTKRQSGGDAPARLVVTAHRSASLDAMRRIHRALGFGLPIDYRLTPIPEAADAVVNALPPGSMVVNATGLGKDAPGSPLTRAVIFPRDGLVWDFNYRGDLVFLDQARAQAADRALSIDDGWVYFIHGWTRVIAEVFAIDIPMEGPAFDALSRIAWQATA